MKNTFLKKAATGTILGIFVSIGLFLGFKLTLARDGLTASSGDKLTAEKRNQLVASISGTNCSSSVSWTTATLQNSWSNRATPYANAGFYKDCEGIVHLRGLIKGGSAGTIFVLPAGYIPSARLLVSTLSNNGTSNAPARIDIDTAGNVSFQAGYTTRVALDNISFSTN